MHRFQNLNNYLSLKSKFLFNLKYTYFLIMIGITKLRLTFFFSIFINAPTFDTSWKIIMIKVYFISILVL